MQCKIMRVIIFGAMLILARRGFAQFSGPAPLSAMTVPQAEQMQPADLARMLKASGRERLLLLQVGSHVMYAQAHIPGSVYAGPGSQAAGLQLLEKAVASTP